MKTRRIGGGDWGTLRGGLQGSKRKGGKKNGVSGDGETRNSGENGLRKGGKETHTCHLFKTLL